VRSSSSRCFDPWKGRTNTHELDLDRRDDGTGLLVPLLGKDLQIARQEHQTTANEALEQVPKKLAGFFDSNMLPLFEFERFPLEHVILRDLKAL
jgi:hypothetical protein